MCHFLVSRGFNFIDPFEDLSVGQLVTMNKYQQKLIKRESLNKITIAMVIENGKSGTEEGKKVYQQFLNDLTRQDQI